MRRAHTARSEVDDFGVSRRNRIAGSEGPAVIEIPPGR